MKPKKGTKTYNKIVKLGCGGYGDKDNFDCEFDYPWTCDNCPCTIEVHDKTQKIEEDKMRAKEILKQEIKN